MDENNAPTQTEAPPATLDTNIESDAINKPTEETASITHEENHESEEPPTTVVNELSLKTPAVGELLKSKDLKSRFMTLFSIIFSILAIVCFSLLVKVYLKKRSELKKQAPITAETNTSPVITELLGEFVLYLKPEASKRIELRTNLSAECSNQVACTYIKEHIAEARDATLLILSTADESDYQNTETKNLIRRKISERLNTLPLGGEVIQVHFNDLMISH